MSELLRLWIGLGYDIYWLGVGGFLILGGIFIFYI